jgi:hypothetical protein
MNELMGLLCLAVFGAVFPYFVHLMTRDTPPPSEPAEQESKIGY